MHINNFVPVENIEDTATYLDHNSKRIYLYPYQETEEIIIALEQKAKNLKLFLHY